METRHFYAGIDVTAADGSDPGVPRPRPVRYAVYRCRECGWQGNEGEMDADAVVGGDAWSNHICPSCRAWHRLEDYAVVSPAVWTE